MIDYQLYHQIHQLHTADKLKPAQIAQALKLNEKTVARWLACAHYQPRQPAKGASQLDPHKGTIIRLLETHSYSSAQLLPRLREQGYTGGYTILKEFVRQVRPAPAPAFLTLQFAPGECAQVDWAQAGEVTVGNTRRRLHFFIMVLCYSRQMFVEFTLSESLEHFLACHQHAFEYFNGVPAGVMVDNCKAAVLRHP